MVDGDSVGTKKLFLVFAMLISYLSSVYQLFNWNGIMSSFFFKITILSQIRALISEHKRPDDPTLFPQPRFSFSLRLIISMKKNAETTRIRSLNEAMGRLQMNPC